MNATEVNHSNSVNINEDRKLTFREKIAASLAGLVGTMHSQIIATFLLFYYTDIMGISPAFVAGLFLIARIIDAILVPVFGIFVDKVTTPWGKYVPWYIILGVPTAIFGWLTFTDFGLGTNSELIYVSLTYLIYSILISIKQAPFQAVPSVITKKLDERISLGQLSYFLVTIGAIFASIGAQPLYKALGGGNDAKGFSLLMGIVALIGIGISIFQVTSLKERYVIHNKKEKRPSLMEMNKAVFTNKAAIIVYVYALAINLANGIRSAIILHYFKYYFNNEGLIVTYGAIALLPTIIGVMLSGKVTKRFGIKANVLTAAIVNVVCSASFMFIPNTSTGVTLFLAVNVIISLFLGIATPAQGTMMPAAMDYSEWKTGISVNGYMGSIQGFLQTLATALAGAIAAGALHFVGYVPGMEQSNETIFGLKMLMGILPAFFLIFTASVALFDISEEKQAQIAKDLKERREQNA